MSWDFLLLWLPITVIAVATFAVYVAAHWITPPRARGRRRLESEREFIDTLSDLRIAPGHYLFPFQGRKANSGSNYSESSRNLQGSLDLWNVDRWPWREIPWIGLFFLMATTGMAFLAWEAFAGWPAESSVSGWLVFRWFAIAGTLIYGCGMILYGSAVGRGSWIDWVLAIVLGLITGAGFTLFHLGGWSFGN